MVARVHNFLRHQRSVLAVTPASSPKAICEAWCTEKFIRTARRTVRRGPRSGPSSVWKRSTIIESSSRAARKSMMGIKTVTRIQQTRSRDPCRTSRLCRRPWHGLASSSLPPGSKWPKRHRSLCFWAQNGQKGIGAFLSHLVGAFVPTSAVLSQELNRNGANGFMVLRLRVSCLHDAGSCSLVRSVRQNRSKRP